MYTAFVSVNTGISCFLSQDRKNNSDILRATKIKPKQGQF